MNIAFFSIDDPLKKDFFTQNLKDHQLTFFKDHLSSESLPEENNFEILSVFVHCKVNQTVIDHFPSLKLIVTRSTGFDHIDLDYAKQKGIIVTNIPSYGSHTVAEFTFSLLLSLLRKIHLAYKKVQSGSYDYQDLLGLDLNEKTIGVVGTGKIGANVIKIANGFNMKILANDAYPNPSLKQAFNFEYIPLDQLLKNSDIITFHVPNLPETRHLLNAQNINQVKKGSYIINTSRGAVIETTALYQALESGQIAGVGLDVLEEEDTLTTLPSDSIPNKLITHPSVLYTPHMAHFSKEAEENILKTTIENILGFLNNSSVNTV